jgi:hypothetical protein
VRFKTKVTSMGNHDEPEAGFSIRYLHDTLFFTELASLSSLKVVSSP